MRLEAVWFENGKEILQIDPVSNIVCNDDMEDISEIEVHNGYNWYSSEDADGFPDDFVIRIKKD